ncbi:hypothetical protein C7M71_008105 [Peterkaempfera bronchialis]|uniref:Uncharacterized protein n=2 Tax=Peterkaempfera bronchialis TaxID=2126346 RepID=A0A345SUK3_9ACTN|nr:hypothetical protein C7M71_008105 [Peterkaempfera bronchialis]
MGSAGPRGSGRWTAVRTAVAVLLLTAWAVLVPGGAAAGAADGDGDGLVKVYVVRSADRNGGTPDTLVSVAARTLGDGNRAGEIFALNRGRQQPDGSALTDPADLRPGWILRLPQDAGGPDVQLARETAAQDGGRQDAAAPSGQQESEPLVIPLPAVLAVVGAILLALLTAGIVARRRVRRAFAASVRVVRRLGEPARRARRLRYRRSLTESFARDQESLRYAHAVLAELTGPEERAVHAVAVDGTGATAWVAATGTPPAPWQDLGGGRWHRPPGAPARPGATLPPHYRQDVPCLVRVGVEAQGRPVFVDLSRLDGVLSVTGDRAVARDTVQTLLAEIARTRPEVPVTALQGTGGLPIALPAALPRIDPADLAAYTPPTRPTAAARSGGTLRAAARLRPLRALLVVPGAPTGRESADLAALCGPGGAGWTALVCGDADGAHWRWSATPDGSLELPLLNLTLTTPA